MAAKVGWSGSHVVLAGPSKGSQCNGMFVSNLRPHVSTEIIHELMSAIQQHTVSPAATPAAHNSNQRASQTDISNVEALSTAADNSSKEASPGMPLLLTSFSIGVPVLPSLLEALPAASLTRLELIHGVDWQERAQLQQAIWQLSSLKHLKLTHERNSPGHMPNRFIQALPRLTILTGLEIDPC